MNGMRIPKSWILLAVFVVSVIGVGAFVFTTPPNGLTNQTGSFFGNTSNNANNYSADSYIINGIGGITDAPCRYGFGGEYDAIVCQINNRIYAINGNTGKIISSAAYAGSDTAVTESAIAYANGGITKLGKNIVYIPTTIGGSTSYTPAYSHIVGSGNTSIISSSDPTKFLGMGVYSSIENVGVKAHYSNQVNAVCEDGITKLNDGCLVFIPKYVHNRNITQVPVWWSGKSIGTSTGFFGIDAPGISSLIYGVGDAIQAQTNDSGVGIRIENNLNQANSSGTGLLILNYGQGFASRLQSINGSSGELLRMESNNPNNVLINILDTNQSSSNRTTDMIQMTSNNIASGDFIKIFQANSTYTGDAITLNLGNYGTCTNANFLRLQNNGSTKVTISCSGVVTLSNNVALFFTDTNGRHPFLLEQNNNKLVLSEPDNIGTSHQIWGIDTASATPEMTIFANIFNVSTQLVIPTTPPSAPINGTMFWDGTNLCVYNNTINKKCVALS